MYSYVELACKCPRQSENCAWNNIEIMPWELFMIASLSVSGPKLYIVETADFPC